MRAVEMLKERQNSRSAHSQLQNQAVRKLLSKNKFRFNGSDVLVFVPVYNEEHTITKVVKGIRDCCNFDLLVIDDGSTDSTPGILRQLDVEVVTHPSGIKSNVLLSGLKVASALGYKYAVKIDGDGQHNPQDIPRLYEHAVRTGADITIGSRHLNGFNAKLLSIDGSGMWFCSKLVSLISRKRITDATSGFKIWNAKACETAIQAIEAGKLAEHSTYHVEELIIAAKKKLKVEEISVVIRPREYGESKSYTNRKLALFPLQLVRSTLRALF